MKMTEANEMSAGRSVRRYLWAHPSVVTLLFALLVGMWSSSAMGQVAKMDIKASFAPNSLDPTHRKFNNDTPLGGLCRRWPGLCRGDQFSIITPLRVDTRVLGGDRDSPRVNYFMGVDAQWKEVDVVHAGGSTHKVRFRISMLSQRYSRNNNGSPSLYGASSGGCGGVGTDIGTSAYHFWGWVLPAGMRTCARATGHSAAANVTITEISVGYELDTPDPLGMLDGEYTGVVSYTVGPGGQIDLGDGQHQHTELEISFTLTVAHDFQVRFASETPKATLAPDGGWSQWMDHGRVPTHLRQELPFHLTSSMDFSMKMRCEHDAPGERCGIRNAGDGEVVPVDVDVTIPGMVNQRDGRPAQFTPLTALEADAPRFSSPQYIQDRRSALRFIAGQEAVNEMVKSPGSQWRGDITIVFDANP